MCQSRGASLVEIYNENMNEQVEFLVNKGGMWLGLVYATKDSFMWTSGEPVNYTNWKIGQPHTSLGNYYTYMKEDGLWETLYPSATMVPSCMKKITMNMLSENLEKESDNRHEVLFDDGSVEEEEAIMPKYKPKLYLNGMILHVGEEPTEWIDAYYFCKRKGLTLPTITTHHLNTMITEQVKQLGKPVWLALVGAGGRFWWMNGIPFEYNELAAEYDIQNKESTYTVLMKDGKWHEFCSNGDCIKALPMCIEIAPLSTAEPALAAVTNGSSLLQDRRSEMRSEQNTQHEYSYHDDEFTPAQTIPRVSENPTTERRVPKYTYTQEITTKYLSIERDNPIYPTIVPENLNYPTTKESRLEIVTSGKPGTTPQAVGHGYNAVYSTISPTNNVYTLCARATEEAKEKQRNNPGSYIYVPDCRSDGSFNPLQCGTMTCWCVDAEGMVLPESVDTSRYLTLQQCLQFIEVRDDGIRDENRIQQGASTNTCMVEGTTHSKSERFRHGCNMCTCLGSDQLSCTPTTECTGEMVLCDYFDAFDYACSKCKCDEYYVTFNCETYDRYCGKDTVNEVNKIWFAAGTQETELTTAQPDYKNNGSIEEVEPVRDDADYATEPNYPSDTVEQSLKKDGVNPTEKVITTESIGEKQYKIYLYSSVKDVSWIDAYYDCQSMGMTLPTIMNDAINNYLQNYLRHDMLETWLDAEQYSGYAYWFSGTPMEYTKWAPYNEPEIQYGRAYVTLSYDGMWYTKQDYQKSSYYCMTMEEVSPKAVKLGFTGKCLVGDKEYYKGDTFGPSCSRCTCYLYSAVYVDCIETPGCVKETTNPPLPAAIKQTIRPQTKHRVKSLCHGGLRYLDCSEPCTRECDSRDCIRHCTEECSCPRERPVFYGGCCVEEAICIDDGYDSWFF